MALRFGAQWTRAGHVTKFLPVMQPMTVMARGALKYLRHESENPQKGAQDLGAKIGPLVLVLLYMGPKSGHQFPGPWFGFFQSQHLRRLQRLLRRGQGRVLAPC